jgi:hypothetical protein
MTSGFAAFLKFICLCYIYIIFKLKQTIMKRAIVSAAIMLMYISLATGQKEERSHDGFTSISFGIPGTLYVEVGSKFSVVLEGDRSVLDNIITDVSGRRLVIKKENWRNFSNEKNVVVRITLPELEGLGVSGSGKAELVGPVNADNLNLSVSGSGNLYAKSIEADRLNCSISGSGNVVISGRGSVDNGEITISGSGNFTGEQLEIDHLEVRVSGSGSCNCRAGDSLTASVSGSGNITYLGDPKVDARVSGSGKVRSR